MNTAHFRKLERMYLQANFNTHIYTTTTVEIGEGVAEVGLTVEEKYFHTLGAIHGSVYFKLMDDAAFFAVNSLVEDVFVLTTQFSTNLIRPANKGKLKAMGKVRFKSQNLFIADAYILNEEGKEIAFGTGHFAKSKFPLTEEIGYK
ncbi:MAG: PaaI family thioesterase [Bacteroidota bacterium]